MPPARSEKECRSWASTTFATFASHLIRAGIDPVRASRQLGHGRPSITLDIYAHEFDHARGLDDLRDSIDAAFGPSRI
jgi:hypothetical protein